MSADERAQLLKLSQQLLDVIAAQDWETYVELCDETLTAFEPEAVGNLVAGMPFHRFYFEMESTGRPQQSTISSPEVRLMGETACVTYVRLTQRIDAEGNPTTSACEETRIWQKQDGRWQHVHLSPLALGVRTTLANGEPTMVILFSRDLMLTSQVSGPATQLGVDVATVGSLEQLSQRAEQGSVTGVILDLGLGDVSPAEVIAAFSGGDSRPRMLAFGPHVRKELFAAAEEAGFDAVLPRGRFVGEVGVILAELDARLGC